MGRRGGVVCRRSHVAILKFLPNARYLYPALPLTLVPLAALLGWLSPGPLRRAIVLCGRLCAAQYVVYDFFKFLSWQLL